MGNTVDVVIPTFRRPEALARCLAALERQTVAPASVEIVDDSQTDRGPAYSRNIGWRRGAASIVAFTDDDCVPSENWIETIQKQFDSGDIGGIEGSVTTVTEGGFTSDMNPSPNDRWNRFKTANMAYRREILESVDGFDERYFIHREDTDLAWRVINSGYRIGWVPECIVHHPDRGGMPRIAPKSEQLLYRCDPKKYVEVASYSVTFDSIRDGSWKRLRQEMKSRQGEDVEPLSFVESAFLWWRAVAKSGIRKLRFWRH